MTSPGGLQYLRALVWGSFAAPGCDDTSVFVGARNASRNGGWTRFGALGSFRRGTEISARSLAASLFPREAVFCNQTLAAAISSVTPRPAKYMLARLNCALAWFRSAATFIHLKARRSSCGTPRPVRYSDANLYWASEFPTPRVFGGGWPHGQNLRCQRPDRSAPWRRFHCSLPARTTVCCWSRQRATTLRQLTASEETWAKSYLVWTSKFRRRSICQRISRAQDKPDEAPPSGYRGADDVAFDCGKIVTRSAVERPRSRQQQIPTFRAGLSDQRPQQSIFCP